MTYHELAHKILDTFTYDQLHSDVTVHISSVDEFHKVDHMELVNDNEEDRLPDGFPILCVDLPR